MTWVLVDDQFPEHPKIVGLTDEAFRAQVTGLCYANRHLTDGTLPMGFVRRFSEDATAELVEAGIWETNGDAAYRIHDYDDYQLEKAEVLADRKAKDEARRRGGLARAATARRINGRFVSGKPVENETAEGADENQHGATSKRDETAGHDQRPPGDDQVSASPNPNPKPVNPSSIDETKTPERAREIADSLASHIGNTASYLLGKLGSQRTGWRLLLETPGEIEKLRALGMRYSAALTAALQQATDDAEKIRNPGAWLTRTVPAIAREQGFASIGGGER